MKKYLTHLIILSLVIGSTAPAQAADTSESLDSFIESYRRQKQGQGKEVKVPLASSDSPKAQEFVARTLYDDALKSFRRKNYGAAEQRAEELLGYLTDDSGVSATVRKRWLRKTEDLLDKIAVREKKQKFTEQRRLEKMSERGLDMPIAEATVAAEQEQLDPHVGVVLSPTQSNVLSLLNHRKQELRSRRNLIQKNFNQGVEAMYGRAMKVYKEKDYWQAKIILEDVQELWPNYKETRKYLERVDRILSKEDLGKK